MTWIATLWRRLFPVRIVYHPETQFIGRVRPEEWSLLMGELVNSYETAMPVYKACWALLRSREQELLNPPRPEDDNHVTACAIRDAETRGQVAILRRIVRLPLEAQTHLTAQERRKEAADIAEQMGKNW